MSTSIEELQDKPYGEILAALADIAPQVLEAKARYDELVAQQRALTAARELVGKGLRLNDTVRFIGGRPANANQPAVVVGGNSGGLIFRRLKNGQPTGDILGEWMIDGYEKIQP